jgi:hypothetical protein
MSRSVVGKMGGCRLLGDRKTPSSRAGAGPVSQGGGDSNSIAGPETRSNIATVPSMFDSPIGLGGGVWKSMGDSFKDFGTSAQGFGTSATNKLNPVNGLKNFSDSALTSAINFNPVDSMKKLSESASNLGDPSVFSPGNDSMTLIPKTNLFGNSKEHRNDDHTNKPDQPPPESGLRLTKTKTGEPVLVSPWRNRKDVSTTKFTSSFVLILM